MKSLIVKRLNLNDSTDYLISSVADTPWRRLRFFEPFKSALQKAVFVNFEKPLPIFCK